MKCKICGTRCRDIAAMAKHYRNRHPGSFRRRKTEPKIRRMSVARDPEWNGDIRYCPHCGKRL